MKRFCDYPVGTVFESINNATVWLRIVDMNFPNRNTNPHSYKSKTHVILKNSEATYFVYYDKNKDVPSCWRVKDAN